MSWQPQASFANIQVMADPPYHGDEWPQLVTAANEPMGAYAAATHGTVLSPASGTMPYSNNEAMAIDHWHLDPTNNTVPRTQRIPRQRVRGRSQRHSSASFSHSDRFPPSTGQIPTGSPPAALAGDTKDPVGRRATQGPHPVGVGGAHPRNSPDITEHFPIRASVQKRALGLGHDDPLLDEVTAVAGNLKESLDQILSKEPPAEEDLPEPPQPPEHPSSALVPATSAVFTHCRGVTGIGGGMVPVKAPNYPTPNEFQAFAAAAGQTSVRDGPPSTPGKAPSNSDDIKAEPEEGGGFKTSFQFVINESTKDARNTVRKHVMREYRRRERWEQDRRKGTMDTPTDGAPPTKSKRRRKPAAKTPTEETAGQEAKLAQALAEMSSSTSSGGASPTSPHTAKRPRLSESLLQGKTSAELAAVIPNFEEALEELERNKDLPYMADPRAAIAASDVDPFSRMQMELGPATRSLLHHFAWVMPSLMDEVVTGTVFNRLGWLYSAVAVHDPKPAHVILGFTLGHIAGLRGQKEPPLAIEHKNRAFELISQRMADPDQAISDDNIGAVVNVAGWELIDCNPEAFALHMRALHHMVVVRGGIGAFGHKPELQTVLIRLDAIRAYITLSKPRYPTYACFRSLLPLAISVPPGRLNPVVPPLAPETPENAFCEDTFYLLHDLEDTLLLLKSISKDSAGPKFSASVKELVVSNIAACLSPINIVPSSFSRSLSRRVTRLAALVFIDAAIQHYFDSGAAPDSGVKRLSARFLGQRADKAAMAVWGRSLEMVIHVLLAADRLALERPWRAWYFADALTLTMKLGSEAWADVERALRDYLEERCLEQDSLVGTRSGELWSLKRVFEATDKAWSEWAAEEPQAMQS